MNMAAKRGGSRYNTGARILAIIMLSSILVMVAVALHMG